MWELIYLQANCLTIAYNEYVTIRIKFQVKEFQKIPSFQTFHYKLLEVDKAVNYKFNEFKIDSLNG